MQTALLEQLASKAFTKEQLLKKVEGDFVLFPVLLNGTSSPKAAIRYGCGNVLMDLSEKYPDKLYPHMDNFIGLLDSKYRILTWNAMAIIANLTRVDVEGKFDAIFDKYYSFLNNEYMVTVANVVGNSARIALAKPYLIQKITAELLKVEDISLTLHLTAECKLVIAEKAVKTFDAFFQDLEDKEKVLAFVKRQLDSTRVTLREQAHVFLTRWG